MKKKLPYLWKKEENRLKIGVLALQGAFIEHEKMLNKLEIQTIEIRQKKDFSKELDGIILPGGESTVMGKLLRDLDLLDPIRKSIQDGLPVLGTCAGLILLAEKIECGEKNHIATMPVTVKRNAYGRQLGSFHVEEEMKGIGRFEMTFIRAPYVENYENGVEVLARVEGKVVAVRYENQIGVAFHPELSDDSRVHELFVQICRENK